MFSLCQCSTFPVRTGSVLRRGNLLPSAFTDQDRPERPDSLFCRLDISLNLFDTKTICVNMLVSALFCLYLRCSRLFCVVLNHYISALIRRYLSSTIGNVRDITIVIHAKSMLSQIPKSQRNSPMSPPFCHVSYTNMILGNAIGL